MHVSIDPYDIERRVSESKDVKISRKYVRFEMKLFLKAADNEFLSKSNRFHN